MPRLVHALPLAFVVVLAACTTGTQASPGARSGTETPATAASPTVGAPGGSTPTAPSTGSSSSAPAPDGTTTLPAGDPLSGWTIEEEVGQIVMVGVSTSAPQRSSHDLVGAAHVGNVFLQGRTAAGRERVTALVHWFTDQVSGGATHGAPMIVATDQEGGLVQTLSGDGFSTIPSALEQGAWRPAAFAPRQRPGGRSWLPRA